MKRLIYAVTVLAVSTAQAATIHVDIANCPGPGDGSVGDPYCSIQTAVDNAVDTDEIVVAPGTYFEAINFNGKAIWLHSSDGAEVTTIDATDLFSGVVTCESGEGPDTVLEGFTLTHGAGTLVETSPGIFTVVGGGMINLASSPTVTNCTFIDNTVIGEFVGGFGGGMYNKDSSPTVTNCTFTGNTAFFFESGRGGGMYNDNSSPTVTDCAFVDNSAGIGSGGMSNHNSSNPIVTKCRFIENSGGFGGGMRNVFSSNPTVTDCTFSGNCSDHLGGGMSNVLSSPTVTNCLFIANDATGGGMYNLNSTPTVTNCTFTGNTDYGMYNDKSNPVVTNCILWGNSPDEFSPFQSTPTVTYSDVQGGFRGTGNIDADPLFVAASDCFIGSPFSQPGCSDPACMSAVCDVLPSCCDFWWSSSCVELAFDLCPNDFRLSAASPCIDAGDNTAVPVGVTTDLDGNPRFVDDPDTPDSGNGDPPIVDMGAYEFQGLPCPWDLDGDSNVFVTDLLLLLMDFGSCNGSPADFDGDGCVTVVDLLTLLGNWGPCPGSPCIWDVNGDGTVDLADLFQVLTNLGPCDGCPEDVNGDGIVNGQDVAAVATHFGPCP